ncbi:unnamed protein product [Polarella glacialis]|uniref:Uncharacterized protein n=1 Tax=Polarella glacialis TaxID=89957 RepID=A0A813F4T4_POLGL|nr:unnamed protein product [Polarella glacialis]
MNSALDSEASLQASAARTATSPADQGPPARWQQLPLPAPQRADRSEGALVVHAAPTLNHADLALEMLQHVSEASPHLSAAKEPSGCWRPARSHPSRRLPCGGSSIMYSKDSWAPV